MELDIFGRLCELQASVYTQGNFVVILDSHSRTIPRIFPSFSTPAAADCATWHPRDFKTGRLHQEDNSLQRWTSSLLGTMNRDHSHVCSCVIAELFLEGTPIFNYAQLLAYIKGEYDPEPLLNRIPDPYVQVCKQHSHLLSFVRN